MPIRYICKKCRFILYEYKRVQWPGLPSPSDIISLFNGKCPRCGRKLEPPDIDDIKVKPL